MADVNRIQEMLEKAKVFQFVTVDGNLPKARPFSFQMMYDGKLVFGTGTHKNVYKQIEENPHVEILATVPGGFMRYDGEVEFLDNPQIEAKAREDAPYMDKMYNEETGLKIRFFHLINDYAEVRTMTGELKETL